MRNDVRPSVRVEARRRDGRTYAHIVHVPPGTLVQYDGVGVQINCAFNEPVHHCQPYVTINTEELPPAHTYDENDPSKPGGMPKIAVHLGDCVLFDDEGAGFVTDLRIADRLMDDEMDDMVYMVYGFNDAVEPAALFVREQDANDFADTYDNATVDSVVICDPELAVKMIAERKAANESVTIVCPSCNEPRRDLAPGSVCKHCGHVEPDETDA